MILHLLFDINNCHSLFVLYKSIDFSYTITEFDFNMFTYYYYYMRPVKCRYTYTATRAVTSNHGLKIIYKKSIYKHKRISGRTKGFLFIELFSIRFVYRKRNGKSVRVRVSLTGVAASRYSVTVQSFISLVILTIR